MIKYNATDAYDVRHLWFMLDGQQIRGEGFLRWEPKKGFRLHAVTSRLKLSPQHEVRMLEAPKGEAFASVRLQLQGGACAFAPSLHLGNHRLRLSEGRLSCRFERLIFFNKNEGHRHRAGHGELVFLMKETTNLPDVVEWSETIDNKPLSYGSRVAGVKLDSDGFKCLGGVIEGSTSQVSVRYFVSHSSTDKIRYTRFPMAFCYALGMLAGEKLVLLRNQSHSGCVRRNEVTRVEQTTNLGYLSPFFGPPRIDKAKLTALVEFFVRNPEYATLCYRLFDQLVVAARQKHWHVSEFLVASAMEALVRAYFKQPYTPGRSQRSFVITNMHMFGKERFDRSSWKKHSARVEAAFTNLRNRNVHPDWVDISDPQQRHAVYTQSIDDMICLCQFYGHAILGLAGIPEAPMKFVEPHSKWGPLMTYHQELNDSSLQG